MPTQPISALPISAQTSQPLRVLIVDDNREAAESLHEILQLSGFTSKLVVEAAQAIEQAREFQPDVVVLDINMPVLNGIELATQLRAEPAFRTTRLIALSGGMFNTDLPRLEQRLIDDYLAKPVQIPVLLELLTTTRSA